MKPSLKVLFLAAEADPLVKIGGLGDVAGSLPPALRALSSPQGTSHGVGELEVDVRLALPFHGAIQRQAYSLRGVGSFAIPFGGVQTHFEALSMDLDGLPVYLIAGPLIPPDAPVYTDDTIADGLKFTFFSLAALELARQLDWAPHVLHANDWHTAPAVYALSRFRDADPLYGNTVTLLGLHNLPYLGAGTGAALAAFGLPPATDSALPEWAQDVPLPLGLLSADHIVAASPTYAKEILTSEFGSGLEDFLRTRRDAISGILNGIDTQRWDPKTDDALVVNYDQENMEDRIANKAALQAELGLDQESRRPLLAIITRMDYQKGIDLVPEALHQLINAPAHATQPWQMIILGTGDPALEEAARRLEVDFPKRVRTAIRFDAALSRRIYAGADMLLIPSRYEPCGLTQMIAMRYGCVPVARATGGLQDTIQDYNQSSDSTGFLFKMATPEALAEALDRALGVYVDREEWQGLLTRGMARDFSWEASARKYLELYLSLVKRTTKREVKL